MAHHIYPLACALLFALVPLCESAADPSTSGKVRVTADVDTVCAIIGTGGETYVDPKSLIPTTLVDVADFSRPGTATITLGPKTMPARIYTCNVPSLLELSSDNGAATTTASPSGDAQAHFDYTAYVEFSPNRSTVDRGNCTYASATNPVIGAPETVSCPGGVQASYGNVVVTITPVDPGTLVPGVYNDVLTIKITAN